MAAKTRKRPKQASKAPEVDDLDDLDGLDDLDVGDLDDLDLDDDEDVDDTDALDEDEDVEEDEDDALDLDDDDEDDDLEDVEDEEPEAEVDDDIGDDLDDDDDLDLDDEPEPAPARKPQAKAKAKPAPKPKPTGLDALSAAQQKMLKASARNKSGAKVANVGQRRTADSLIKNKLAKWAETEGSGGVVVATAKGCKLVGVDEVAYVAPVAKPAPKAKPKAQSTKKGKAPATNGAVPKGMVGIAKIAAAASKSHGSEVREETVRRVLKLNADRFSKHSSGRWVFSKEDAKEVLREVRSYLKYTGGKRGRPEGAATQLPDGKVGPSTIAEMAEVHRNTVYKFLQSKPKLAKFRNEDGMYLFTEKQAQQLAAKIGA